MENIQICATISGFLYAITPDGTEREILVDVPGTSNYGCLRLESDLEKTDREHKEK